MEQFEHPSGDTAGATVVVASRYGTLWALNTHDGAIRWRLAADGRNPALIHTSDMLYVSSKVPLGAYKELEDRASAPATPGNARTLLHASPAEVVALRIADGATIWQRHGWTANRNALAIDGDLLLSVGPVANIGEVQFHAYNRHSGAIRWTYDVGLQHRAQAHLLGARAGRIFVSREGFSSERRIDVLDAESGAVCWSKQAYSGAVRSPNGALVALTPFIPAPDGTLPIHSAHDGSEVGRLLQRNGLLALSDDDIAYVASSAPMPRASTTSHASSRAAGHIRRRVPEPTLAAIRINDGAELWRNEQIEASRMAAANTVLTADTLYFAHMLYPEERGEVTALDVRTGRTLWRWQTPGSLVSLLGLWGARTTGVMLTALASARRSMRRASDSRDRAITMREVINGQWRHPTHLVSYVGVYIAVHHAAIYLATSLGLFALDPQDGRLRWHALPTSELTHVLASSPPV